MVALDNCTPTRDAPVPFFFAEGSFDNFTFTDDDDGFMVTGEFVGDVERALPSDFSIKLSGRISGTGETHWSNLRGDARW